MSRATPECECPGAGRSAGSGGRSSTRVGAGNYSGARTHPVC